MANEITVNNTSNKIIVNENNNSISVSTAISKVSVSSIGIQGSQGIQGIQGQRGDDGRSAYDIAVQYGFTGTEEEFALKNEMELSAKVDKLAIGDTETNYVNIFLYNMLN